MHRLCEEKSMKVNQSEVLLSGLPIILLVFALLTSFISDFKSVIGLILCIAAIISSLERTIYAYSKKKWPLFLFCIFMTLISIIAAIFYHAMMTWDYGPFYFPVSE
tara:strand:+ start:836 stop:1153 length:318 start_codon:yes stop_codon:yes gene_type:complete